MTQTKVLSKDVEDIIVAEFYYTANQGVEAAARACGEAYEHGQPALEALKRLTHCTLVLKNGFTVTGSNACVSAENWDRELGKRYAKENAVETVWLLLGYALKDRLYCQGDTA